MPISKEIKMETCKSFIKIVLFILITVTTTTGIANAQNLKKDKQVAKIAAVKNLIDSQDFVFVAEYVSPVGRRRKAFNIRL